MSNEIGPENKVSRTAAARFCYCPCGCYGQDVKGNRVECRKPHNGVFKPSKWMLPLNRLLGKKGRTLRSHRKGRSPFDPS